MSIIPIHRALDTVQANLVAFLKVAGQKIERCSVRLDVGGSTASIDFNRNPYDNAVNCTVLFPVLPAQSGITREEMNRWIGYAVHELCHALYSDRAAWNEAVRTGISALVNGLEDVRIEKKLNATGLLIRSQEILNGLLAWVTAQCPANYDPNDFSQLPWTVAMIGRIRVCGYDIAMAESFAAKLSPVNKPFFDWIMARVAKTASTADVLALAVEIQARLAKTPTTPPQSAPQSAPQPPQSPTQSQTDTETGQSPETGGDASQSPESGSTEPEGAMPDDAFMNGDSGQSPEGEGEESEGETGNEVSGNGGKPDDSKPDDSKPAPFDVTGCKPVDMNPVSQETREESRKVGGFGDLHSEIIEARRRNPMEPLPFSGSVLNHATMKDLSEKLATVNKLKNQVAAILRASDSVAWERSRPAGRLDRGAMARIGAGQVDNVFTVRREAIGYETEIAVLIDASDSMITHSRFKPLNRSEPATVLAMAVASAAYQVGVPCEIIQFSSAYFHVVKSPKEKPRAPAVMARFAHAAHHVNGFTPLSVSIVRVAGRLTARAPHKRRIVFAVTDGGCDMGPDAIRIACGVAGSMGVETVGLCIDLEPQGFPLATRCTSKNIAQAGLGILQKALAR